MKYIDTPELPTLYSDTLYIDFETTDTAPASNLLLFSVRDKSETYVINIHAIGEQAFIDWFRIYAEDAAITKVAHNAAFEYNLFFHRNVRCEPIVCTMIQEQLLQSGLLDRGFGLADLAHRYLGRAMNKKVRDAFIGRSFDIMPLTQEEIDYSAGDVDALEPIYAEQCRVLDERGMGEVRRLESALVPAIATMMYDGVRINAEELQKLAPKLDDIIRKTEASLQRTFITHGAATSILFSRDGYMSVNPRSPLQMRAAFNAIGIDAEGMDKKKLADWDARWAARQKKKKSSVIEKVDADDDFSVGYAHPILRAHGIRSAAAKLQSTYVRGLLNSRDANDIIHTQYDQCGARATGRLSSKRPNLQNIPRKDKLEALNLGYLNIRSMFIPRDGWAFIIADYSGIELSILAEFSKDTELEHQIIVGDIHSYVANSLCGDQIRAVIGDYITPENKKEDKVKEIRDLFKPVSYGTVYGSTGFNLFKTLYFPLHTLGINVTQATCEEWVRRWKTELFPGTGKYLDQSAANAVTRMWTASRLGRRRYWGQEIRENKWLYLAAMREGSNHPIQATCADMLKLAMLYCYMEFDRSSARLAMTVHDELVVEARQDVVEQVAQQTKKHMEDAAMYLFPDANPKLFVAEPKISSRYDK